MHAGQRLSPAARRRRQRAPRTPHPRHLCAILQASIFHLRHAAVANVPRALLILAKAHLRLTPDQAPFAAVAKEAAACGLLPADTPVATKMLERAADCGVRGAAIALAHACEAGRDVSGAAAPGGADAAAAVRWLRAALAMPPGDSVRPVSWALQLERAIYRQPRTEMQRFW